MADVAISKLVALGQYGPISQPEEANSEEILAYDRRRFGRARLDIDGLRPSAGFKHSVRFDNPVQR